MRRLPGGWPMVMVLAHHPNMVRNPSDLVCCLVAVHDWHLAGGEKTCLKPLWIPILIIMVLIS